MIAAVLAAAIGFTVSPGDAVAPAAPAEVPGVAAQVLAAAKPAAAPPAPPITSIPAAPAEGPDIELHVPRAEIAKLGLDVENLQARLDIDTSVAGLARISAGIVATVEKLKTQLEGVQAETHLVVRLNRVADVMERALGTVDTHPDIAGAPRPAPTAATSPASPQPTPAVSVDAAVVPLEAPLPASQE
jgi:hypothetical protein